ncbi:MAG: DUF6010 family protein [Acidobacteriota bacterium]|nr:DUF6010 family protein [Acidobacteriota bacterium]
MLLIAMLGLILGIVLSLALIYLAHTRPPKGERRVYAIGLVVAALIYVGFGVIGGANARWLMIEIVGVLIYGVAAWIGLRGWTSFLALGWMAHVAWDVLLHLSGAGSEYTPDWYPWLCVSFDSVVAGAILKSIRRETSDI